MFKKPLKALGDWLYFTLSERRAAFYLGAFVIVLSLTPFVYDKYFRPDPKLVIQEKLINQLEPNHRTKKNYSFENRKGKIHINEAEWIDLVNQGISKNTAGKIVNYRKSIEGFSNVGQLERVYGINPAELNLLRLHFVLPTTQSKENTMTNKNPNSPDEKTYDYTLIEVNINTADSLEILSIPGFGAYYTSRILNFRRSMGGFHSKKQLQYVYGIPDSTLENALPYVKCEGEIKKIEINLTHPSDLAKHPLITNKEAKLIFAYRIQHGEFKSLDDVVKAARLTQNKAERLEPYLSY